MLVRPRLLAAAMAAWLALLAPQSALAAITVDVAEIVNGRLVVSGRNSSGNETIRIVGTEYFATSGAAGDFLLHADFVPPNCVVALATANETTGELPVANCTRKGVAEPVTPAAADYYVQVSAYGTEEAAQAKLRELLAQSPNLFGATPGVIQKADLPQGLFFLVQFGPMVGQANAEALRQSLPAAGIDAFVTRHAVTLVPVTFTVVQAIRSHSPSCRPIGANCNMLSNAANATAMHWKEAI